MSKQQIQLVAALLGTLMLSACNNGTNSASSSNNAVQTNQLQNYINSLKYTPAGAKQVTDLGTNQQSFTTPGDLNIQYIEINFYEGAYCSGPTVQTQTLSGGETGVTPLAGTYSSSNASNNAVCTNFASVSSSSSGCGGMYDDMKIGMMRSMQFVYHLNTGQGSSVAVSGACMYNPDATVGSTSGLEGIANWSSVSASESCAGESCGFSQDYNVNITPPQKVIFVTAATYDGNLGGLDGADAKCNADANKPPFGTYKAELLPRDVYTVGVTYYRTDLTTAIGTASSANLIMPLDNSVSASTLTPNIAWTSGSSDCGSWAESSSGYLGGVGSITATSSQWISRTPEVACDQQSRLYCVGQ